MQRAKYGSGSRAIDLLLFLIISLSVLALSCQNAGMDSSGTQPSRRNGYSKVFDNWKIQLDGTDWHGSTVTVKLTITNLGTRRNFGPKSFMDPGPDLVAVDSTNKIVYPWVPEPDMRTGKIYVPPYTREFYPNESWSGSLKFEMSPYSGETTLCIKPYQKPYPLFSLGKPRR